MTVAEALTGVYRLAVDTSALIDFVEQAPRSVAALRKIFTRAESNELELMGSVILTTETLLVGTDLGTVPIDDYEAMLKKIELVAVVEPIARRAAEYRITYGMATADALHLATEVMLDCDALVTCDGGFLRAQGIPVGPGKTLKIIKVDRLT